MNATPERPKDDKSEAPLLSRLQQIRVEKMDDHYLPDMPPVDAQYLVSVLFEVGPTMAAGSGIGPITNSELLAWQVCTGVRLTTWEARTLRRLSLDYLNQAHLAKEIGCPAPWVESADVIAIPDHKTKTMRDSIRALAIL